SPMERSGDRASYRSSRSRREVPLDELDGGDIRGRPLEGMERARSEPADLGVFGELGRARDELTIKAGEPDDAEIVFVFGRRDLLPDGDLAAQLLADLALERLTRRLIRLDLTARKFP